MKRVFKTKPLINKNNKQISILIPKRKFTVFKKGVPKSIKVEITDLEW